MPIGISTKVGLFSHDVNARKNLAVIGDLVLEPYVAYVPLMFQFHTVRYEIKMQF